MHEHPSRGEFIGMLTTLTLSARRETLAAYGNAYWSDRGARPIAYTGLRTELAKSEPELFGGGPGLWQKMADSLPQLRASRPIAPSYVKNGTTFGSGSDAMPVIHPGIGHTHSDAVVWVPAKRALFTGDLVVNGPYNAVADSTIGSWIRVLDDLAALRPEIVVRDMVRPPDQNSSARSSTILKWLRKRSTVPSHRVERRTPRFPRSIGAYSQILRPRRSLNDGRFAYSTSVRAKRSRDVP